MAHPTISEQITFLYTTDLAATADFYENIIGLDLWRDQGICRIYKVSADGYLGFCERSDASTEHPDVIFTIVTPEKSGVDKWYEFLREKGVEFEKAPAANPKYKIYHCFLSDPNGYLIEIQWFVQAR